MFVGGAGLKGHTKFREIDIDFRRGGCWRRVAADLKGHTKFRVFDIDFRIRALTVDLPPLPFRGGARDAPLGAARGWGLLGAW